MRLLVRGKARGNDYSWLRTQVLPIGISDEGWAALLQKARGWLNETEAEKVVLALDSPRTQPRVSASRDAQAILGEARKLVEQEEKKKLILDCGDGVRMTLRLIPPGEFMMGSPNGEAQRDSDEGPVHRVHIVRPFYMGIHEVTQEQWQAVMGSNPANFKGAKNPVECVSWNESQEFCKRASLKTGLTLRLPTEAEWEYACRAGTTTRFSFGDSDNALRDYAWYGENSSNQTHPVGQKKPNAWGLYDMHGNVWEWCQSLDKPYAYREDDGREDLAAGGVRVLRGGSWSGDPGNCRSANRGRNDPTYRIGDSGFRVVVPARQE
jgi:formylglycine-generating enzyme required for sulfatase activity